MDGGNVTLKTERIFNQQVHYRYDCVWLLKPEPDHENIMVYVRVRSMSLPDHGKLDCQDSVSPVCAIPTLWYTLLITMIEMIPCVFLYAHQAYYSMVLPACLSQCLSVNTAGHC